jgi:hypothetical protein
MNEGQEMNLRSYLSFSVVAALMVVWILAAWSGFLLGVVPDATGDSHRVLLLGYTRAEWGLIHSWLSVLAVFISAIEIMISWKSLREGIGYLTEAKSERSID